MVHFRKETARSGSRKSQYHHSGLQTARVCNEPDLAIASESSVPCWLLSTRRQPQHYRDGHRHPAERDCSIQQLATDVSSHCRYCCASCWHWCVLADQEALWSIHQDYVHGGRRLHRVA